MKNFCLCWRYVAPWAAAPAWADDAAPAAAPAAAAVAKPAEAAPAVVKPADSCRGSCDCRSCGRSYCSSGCCTDRRAGAYRQQGR